MEDIPRFIVGLPRAGSTWLCRTLNCHQDIFAFGETMYWGKRYTYPNSLGQYNYASLQKVFNNLTSIDYETTVGIQGYGSSKYVNRNDIAEIVESAISHVDMPTDPGTFFNTFCSLLANLEQKKYWIEKTPHHLHYCDRILKFLPNARFLVLLREPYSFLLSYKHQKGHRNTAESQKRFKDRYHPIGSALVWKETCNKAYQLLRDNPDNCMVIDYAKLFSDTDSVLGRILNFFQIGGDDLTVVADPLFSSFNKETKPKLQARDIFWMNLIAGSQIIKLGYPIERARFNIADIIDIAGSVWDIPFWIFRMIKDTQGICGESTLKYLLKYLH